MWPSILKICTAMMPIRKLNKLHSQFNESEIQLIDFMSLLDPFLTNN